MAWEEHDDEHVANPPAARGLEDQDLALVVRDFGTREVDRALSLEGPLPALDVNALDEVPCSTWFCPRHHLDPMTPEEVAQGPPRARPPRLPLTITQSKARGVASGFTVRDATGRKFLVKLDPPGHPGLASGADVVGNALFHAAGYNVPGALHIEFHAQDLRIAPEATYKLSGVAARRFTRPRLDELLQGGARTAAGRHSAVAVPWIEGKVLGAFDMMGTRPDDPNDRYPHQHRRSLRASRLLFAWLNVSDPSALNTVDSYVEENGKRFVRHHFIDFGAALGSASQRPKALRDAREAMIEPKRMLAAFLTLGAYQRRWQQDKAAYRTHAGSAPPAVGWLHPVEPWQPDDFRANRRVPAHVRMTLPDAYWGAKVITSFRDEHLRALVSRVYRGEAEAAAVLGALVARRDQIGKHHLNAYAATERPRVDAQANALCFEDIAVARGLLPSQGLVYHYAWLEDRGGAGAAPIAERRRAAGRGQTCLALPNGGSNYLVVSVRSEAGGRTSFPTSIHLLRRSVAQPFKVVGIERKIPGFGAKR